MTSNLSFTGLAALPCRGQVLTGRFSPTTRMHARPLAVITLAKEEKSIYPYIREYARTRVSPLRSVCLAEEFAWNGGSEDHCAVLRSAARRITEFYDRFLKPSGLTATQFFVLVAVDAGEDVSIKKIAARFIMNRTTATRCLQSLKTAGFVTMETSSKDGRALTLAMTDKGERALKTAVPLWRKAQAAFDKANGADSAKALRAALNNIRLDSAD